MPEFETTGEEHTHSGESVTPGQGPVTMQTSDKLAAAVRNIITEDEYKSLCKKEQLTDEEFASVIDYQLTQSMKPLNLNIKTISQKQVFELYRLYRNGIKDPIRSTQKISLDNLENLEHGVAGALGKFYAVSIKKATIETADQGGHFINVGRLTVGGIKQEPWDVIYKNNYNLMEFYIGEDVIVKRSPDSGISTENIYLAKQKGIRIPHAGQFYRDE